MTATPPTVLIISAIRDELMPTVRRLRLDWTGGGYSGTVAGMDVLARHHGVGRDKAVITASLLLDSQPIVAMMNIGFAGALNPDLAPGQLITPHCVMDITGKIADLRGPVPVIARYDAIHHGSPCLRSHYAVVCTPFEKGRLWGESQCQAVDIETFPLAHLAAQRHLRFISHRAVIDPAWMELPVQSVDWVGADGERHVVAPISYLLLRPWKLRVLWRLGKYARLAGESLARAVEASLHQLSAQLQENGAANK